MEEAHKKAFKHVSCFLYSDIIQKKDILGLQNLREKHTKILKTANYPNRESRGEILKNKMEKHERYGNCISFVKVDDKLK